MLRLSLLFLLFLALLTPSFSFPSFSPHSSLSQNPTLAYIQTSNISKQDIDCLKYFGLKKVFRLSTPSSNFSNQLSLYKKNFLTSPDAMIFIKGNEASPGTLITQFANIVNRSNYQTLWLYPDSTTITCQFLQTYLYYCIKLNLICGFVMNDEIWERIVGNDRLGCKEASVVPLFYWDSPQTWKVMGGWKSYKYSYPAEEIKFCYSNTYSLKTVQRYGDGDEAGAGEEEESIV